MVATFSVASGNDDDDDDTQPTLLWNEPSFTVACPLSEDHPYGPLGNSSLKCKQVQNAASRVRKVGIVLALLVLY